ncbi:MAG: sensor histidine kinase, partial [Geobacter sp.]
EDGLQGLEKVRTEKPDLIVVDLKMPKIGGMEVISRVREIDSEIVLVVITGYATISTAVEAMKAGAYDFLPKPFTADELRLIVNRGLERRHLMEESKRLRQEKEKMQRHFITFVSHELQSPLVAVQQYLDVLNHLGDTPQREQLQVEWTSRCSEKVKDLLSLIRDWLTISKIEGGALVDRMKAISPATAITEVVRMYEGQAREHGIALKLDMPERVSPVKCNEECLNIIFSNLVVNAIKYNKPEGTVTISVEETTDEVVVSVSDTGIGIPEENRESIFEEFGRVKCDMTKDIPGTGLGLPICRKILHELGGKIEVHSTLNEGSTFRVSLPRYKEP